MRCAGVGVLISLLACGSGDSRSSPQQEGPIVTPETLVHQYVERDALGERLRSAPWFLEVVTWSEEPAYDSYTVIRSYEVQQPVTINDTLFVPVTYHRLGWIETTQDSARLIVSDSVEHRQFAVVPVEDGWRITSPRLDPHVLVDPVLRVAPLIGNDRDRLSAIRSEHDPSGI